MLFKDRGKCDCKERQGSKCGSMHRCIWLNGRVRPCNLHSSVLAVIEAELMALPVLRSQANRSDASKGASPPRIAVEFIGVPLATVDGNLITDPIQQLFPDLTPNGQKWSAPLANRFCSSADWTREHDSLLVYVMRDWRANGNISDLGATQFSTIVMNNSFSGHLILLKHSPFNFKKGSGRTGMYHDRCVITAELMTEVADVGKHRCSGFAIDIKRFSVPNEKRIPLGLYTSRLEWRLERFWRQEVASRFARKLALRQSRKRKRN